MLSICNPCKTPRKGFFLRVDIVWQLNLKGSPAVVLKSGGSLSLRLGSHLDVLVSTVAFFTTSRQPKTDRNARQLHFSHLLDSKNEREHETITYSH